MTCAHCCKCCEKCCPGGPCHCSRKCTLSWILITPLVLGIIIGAFCIWAVTGVGEPTSDALDALNSNDLIQIMRASNGDISFIPTNANTTFGLIFYPGAKVDPRAYALYARQVALLAKIQVFIPFMPLYLAILDINAGDRFINANPTVQKWILSGHSLGGAMIGAYINGMNADKRSHIFGFILFAAQTIYNLSSYPLKAVIVSASLDGLFKAADVEANKVNDPADTTFIVVPGGDHAQFGSYGPQAGDNPATLSADVQLQYMVNATLNMLT